MSLRRLLLPLGVAGALLLSGCTARDDEQGTETNETPIPSSVDFLLFPNAMASLGVGDYSIVFSNTTLPTSPATYRLTVVQTDGIDQTFTGTWSSGDTVTQPIEVKFAGGAQIALNVGGATATLSLRVAGNSTDIASTTGADPVLSLPRFQTDQEAYAIAYYAVLDPLNERTTLEGWKAANSFTACDYHVKFRDVRDLGYGRDMCGWRDDVTGHTYFFVRNFQVKAAGEGYGPMNLSALIADDTRWHVGTNAIEFAPIDLSSPVSASNPRVAKFYTFNPDGTRRLMVDLDGQGAKAMPIPCISCHGGMAWPLTADGSFPGIGPHQPGNTLANLQPFDVNSFDFSDQAPYRRSDQEAALKGLNQLILCSFPLPFGTTSPHPEDACRTAAPFQNQWQGTAAEMIKAWYGGDGMPSDVAVDTYVPVGWQDGKIAPVSGEVVPAGATDLYRNVIVPYCRVCHIQRGNNSSASAGMPGSDDIDFMEYQKFIGSLTYNGFSEQIRYHVFEKGSMPLALLKYDQFWESPAPDLLASVIGATDGNGTTLRPLRPVAKPGPDRTVVTGVAVKLSAAESLNATSYRWTITSANADNATLTNANSVRPTFTANVSGVYTLELVVSDGRTDSDPATLTIGAAATLTDGAGIVTVTDPGQIRFSHIRAILQDNTTYSCTAGCHSNGVIHGPPVYYNNYDRDGDSDVDADDLHQFYLDIRARINFTNIESSRLLQRPSGNHHPGGQIANFDATVTPGSPGRGAYDIFLNWILHGAPE